MAGRLEVGCGDINDPVNGGVLATISYNPATGAWTSNLAWQSTRPAGATATLVYIGNTGQNTVSIPPNRSGTVTTSQLAAAGVPDHNALTFLSLTCG